MHKADYLAEILRSRITRGEWPDSGVLPPVRHMAREWGTSVPTILKALGLLVGEGLLEHGTRGRYATTDNRPHVSVPRSATGARYRPRDLEIAEALKVDILAGLFPRRSALPSIKSLRERFSCSHPLVGRALARLRREGYVQRIGNRYRVRPIGAAAMGSAQVVLTGATGIVNGAHAERLGFISALERELHARQWGPLRLFLADDPAWGTPPPNHLVAALIHFGHQTLSHNWHDFFRERPSIPLVVVDHSEMIRWELPRGSRHYWILPDNREAGREAARLLLGYGHRRIAVFRHVPLRERWAELRLRGVRDVYGMEEAGLSARSFGGTKPGRGTMWGVTRRINELRRCFADSPLGSLPVVKERVDRIYDLRGLWENALAMGPAFDEALGDRGITAWVCINDELALVAKAFLENRGVRVGREISLIAFDNAPASHSAGIASYDFAYERMGHMAINCLDSPSSAPVDEEGYIRVHGRPVPRPSVGPAMPRRAQP